VLAQPLLVIFGGMVFGALIDGGRACWARAARPAHLRIALVLLAVAFPLVRHLCRRRQITSRPPSCPHISRPGQQAPALVSRRMASPSTPHAPDADRAAIGGVGR
jgi:ABC-type uncharacterized transport system permease subunit